MWDLITSLKCVPYMVTVLDETPTFEWYIARFVVKNRAQKDMCLKDIELCAQTMHEDHS